MGRVGGFTLRAAAVGLAIAATGCDKVPLLAPTQSTLTLSAGTTRAPLESEVEISATVQEQSGTPVQDGTLVTFTTTLGTLSSREAQTSRGTARVRLLTGSVSGIARVNASSGGARTTAVTTGSGTTVTTTSGALEIQIGAAGVASVLVSASPSSLPVSGGTAVIIAAAIDDAGNRLTGVPISFSTTAGTLSASSATTDAAGEARVNLSGNAAATVTARAGAQSATVALTVNVAPSVTLAVAPASAVAGQPVTLTVTPATGAAPRVTVNWGDGNADDLGVVASARGAVHVYSNGGAFTITATATQNGESFTTATSLTVGPRPTPTVSVSPSVSGTVDTLFSFRITPILTTGVRGVSVDFGDGQTQELGPITVATIVTHQYAAPGVYTVRVRQVDGNGNDSTALLLITVT